MEEKTKLEILKVDKDEAIIKHDDIIIEKPYTIFVNEIEISTLLCTPKSIKYLAVGFLFTEGLLNLKTDIKKINIDENKGTVSVELTEFNKFSHNLSGKKTMTLDCRKGTLLYNVIEFKSKKNYNEILLNKNNIIETMIAFNEQSILFKETGGVHSCALGYNKKIIRFEEDIGRHNAMDKIIGWSILNDINFKDKYILTSGRISSEIIKKVAKCSIPAIISRSAPTSLSIQIAEKLNIMIIGFARGRKMNIYTKYDNFIM
ncbi:formate dehydrogenase accessory sulfurtransferase FdhD [Abyssisolibacter fermentans]|uniref:formate dehydrogenase accessory sulfurtransferase FdhD n=1 Tax=Abyssisolibacter fermentans TaxID=1766203 RepID=UPI00083066E7|nr:formate dehydrogenase accessory sulfurtransferase FdhD [Abyssisolibacter fermentans]